MTRCSTPSGRASSRAKSAAAPARMAAHAVLDVRHMPRCVGAPHLQTQRGCQPHLLRPSPFASTRGRAGVETASSTAGGVVHFATGGTPRRTAGRGRWRAAACVPPAAARGRIWCCWAWKAPHGLQVDLAANAGWLLGLSGCCMGGMCRCHGCACMPPPPPPLSYSDHRWQAGVCAYM